MSTRTSSEMLVTPTLSWQTIYRLTVAVCYVLLTIGVSTFTWWISRTSGSTSISASQGASMYQQSFPSERDAQQRYRFPGLSGVSSYSSSTAQDALDQTQTKRQSSFVARFTTWLRSRLSSVLRKPLKTNSSTSIELISSSQSLKNFGTEMMSPSPMSATVIGVSPLTELLSNDWNIFHPTGRKPR